jgi:hypothetical protein
MKFEREREIRRSGAHTNGARRACSAARQGQAASNVLLRSSDDARVQTGAVLVGCMHEVARTLEYTTTTTPYRNAGRVDGRTRTVTTMARCLCAAEFFFFFFFSFPSLPLLL